MNDSPSTSLAGRLARYIHDPKAESIDPEVQRLLQLAKDLKCLRDLDHPDEPIPANVGPFKVISPLGRGGFGNVYLAVDSRTGRNVALKVPRGIDVERRGRLLAEARAAAELDHPNVVPLYESGLVQEQAYLVSAYVPGPTLAQWLQSQQSPVPRRKAIEITLGIARGVLHAHKRGILHRDLKPANVMLHLDEAGGAPVPRVFDFGLAWAAWREDDDLTPSGFGVGTPPYAAPEQLLGDSKLTEAVDVFSLGVVLFELLDGGCPDPRQLYRNAGGSQSPIPMYTKQPYMLRAFLSDCLAFDKSRRLPTMSVFIKNLEALRDAGLFERTLRRLAGIAKHHRIRSGVLLMLTASAITAGVIANEQSRGFQLAERLLNASPNMAASFAEDVWAQSYWASEHLERAACDLSQDDPRRWNALLGLMHAQPERIVPQVVEHLEHLPLDALQQLGIRLRSVAPLAVPPLLHHSLSVERDLNQRARSAALLAQIDPTLPEWTHIAAELTPWLLSRTEDSAVSWAALLADAKDAFEGPLQQVLREWQSPRSILAAAIIAVMWKHEDEKLLGYISEGSAAHATRFAASLTPTATTRDTLIRRLSSATQLPSSSQGSKEKAKLRVNAAVALARLGPSLHRPFDLLFEDINDPTCRTRVFYELPNSMLEFDRWATLALSDWGEVPSNILFGRLICLASVIPALPPSGVIELVRQGNDIYRQHPDAGIHAAASHLLVIAGEKGRDLLDASNGWLSLQGFSDQRSWFHGPNGHVFAIVEMPSSEHKVAISIYSTSNGQFSRFRPKWKLDSGPSVEASQPVSQLSLQDMIEYCDWLNGQATPGLPRCEPVFIRRQKTSALPAVAHQKFWLRAGYRLPLAEELLVAQRGLADTLTSCGNDVELLTAFGVFEGRPNGVPLDPRLIVPNRLGFADLLGNMVQIVLPPDFNPNPENGAPFKVARIGTSFNSSRESAFRPSLRADWANWAPDATQVRTFRVARVVR